MESKGADFSTDKRHRFKLWRIWDETLPMVLCIGLNPSNANADKNDPTINNLTKILTRLGFGGFYMMNCFTIISSDPGILSGVDINDSVSTDNHYMVGEVAEECREVIFAWGTFDIIKTSGIGQRWREMFPEAKCFGQNKDGSPMHPMGLMWSGKLKTAELVKFN